MEGLSKKAFDFSQLAHIYSSLQHIPYEPSFIKYMLSPHGLEQTGASMAAGEGAKRWFGARKANLLNTGIEMGKNNQQMNPYLSTFSRNWLGKTKMSPYDEGIRVGNEIRSRGLTGEDEHKYIQNVVDQKAAERETAAAASKNGKVKDPVLNAYDQYQTGSFRHNKVFNGLVNAKPIAQDDKALAQKAIAHGISAPIAKFVDPTAIARPILNQAEKHPVTNDLINNKMFPQDTTRGKAYSKVKDFIDY